MPFTVDKAELDRYAAGLEREVARDLRGALGWFGADEHGPTCAISRHDLQQFVHYTLPRKYLAGVEEHVAVARALGDALEHLDAPADYAELCRSPETIALLRLWAVDEDAAFARFACLHRRERPRAARTSRSCTGTGSWAWPRRGRGEAATLALERALESGDRRPAATIVRAVLAEPDPDGGHPSACSAVQAERIDRWAGWRSTARRALLEPLFGELVDVQVPEWPADDVLDWLLDEARAGLALTERGALSRALCVEIARRRPDWTWGKPPRSEADVENLASLHAALRGLGPGAAARAQAARHQARGRAEPGARRLRLLEHLLDGDSFLGGGRRADAGGPAAGRARRPGAGRRGDRRGEGWRSDGGPLPRLRRAEHDDRRPPAPARHRRRRGRCA